MKTLLRLVKDGKIIKQEVKLGDQVSGNKVQVLSGLSDGDQVVLQSSKYLKEGQQVQLESK